MANFTDPTNNIDPELLTDYATAQYPESNRLMMSGVLQTMGVPGITEHSTVVEMPQWNALGDMEQLVPGNELNSEGLTDHKARHPIVRKYKLLENLDLAGIIMKGDPNQEGGRQIALNYNRALNISAIAAMQGACAANTSNVVADTSAAAAATDFTKLEAVFGDTLDIAFQGNGVWIMRSKLFQAYKELGLVADPLVGDEFQDNVVAGRNFMGVRGSILGRNIIVDDELFRAGLTSKTSGDALTYLAGFGAIASAIQKEISVEDGRDLRKQADLMSWSFHRSVGVPGMDYTATVPKYGPSDADLRNSSNYSLVAEYAKFVPVASIQTNYPS